MSSVPFSGLRSAPSAPHSPPAASWASPSIPVAAIATNWPSLPEASGEPSTMAPSGHPYVASRQARETGCFQSEWKTWRQAKEASGAVALTLRHHQIGVLPPQVSLDESLLALHPPQAP